MEMDGEQPPVEGEENEEENELKKYKNLNEEMIEEIQEVFGL